MHRVKWYQVFLFNISNSIYQVFLSNMNNLHTAVRFQMTNDDDNNNPKQKIEQSYLTPRWDPNKCYYSGSEWIWE